MSALPWVGAALLFLAAALMEEAAVWFGRNALDRLEDDEEGAEGRAFARSARQARLTGRFLVAAALVGLTGASAAAPDRYPLPVVFVIAALWALGGAALSAIHWRSPLGLAGRVLFRPLRVLADPLRWTLATGQRLPGMDRVLSAGERVRELDHELRWLTADTGEDEEGNLLATLHDFGEALVEDVMVPREETVGIPAEARIPEMLELVAREGYSRYPVYRDSPDAVVGVLHVFDLLSAGSEATAGSLAHEPYFTNATKPAGTLLRELQVTYNQMAVVVDEYGGVAGVITVEDLLEELVGEIRDELDTEEEIELRRLEPGVYWVDGTMRIDDLNEALDLDLEEGEYDTVAGLVLEHFERIPRPGERLKVDGVWLEVVQAEPQRIHALRLTLVDREKTGEAS